MKRIYFARHGETEGNIGKYFQDSETKLSEAGHKGAQALAERFAHVELDEVRASKYLRAQQTASYVAKKLEQTVVTDNFAHEVLRPSSIHGIEHFSAEGRAHRESYVQNFLDKNYNLDGAENYYTFIQRLQSFIDGLEENIADNILIISHANFIRHSAAYLLLGKVVDSTHHMKVFSHLKKMSNVGISEFIFEDNNWSLQHWNDHAHFAE